MTEQERVERIIGEISELSGLLKVIGESTASPLLYRLIREKSERIATDIRRITDEVPAAESPEEPVAATSVRQPEPVAEPLTPGGQETEAYAEPPTEVATKIVAEPETEPETPVAAELAEQIAAEEPVKSPAPTPTEGNADGQPVLASTAEHLTLDDLLQRRLAREIKKAMSLNDRFRFRRELFGGDDELMNDAIEALERCGSLPEAMDYLEMHFDWDREREVTVDFMGIVEKRFA